MTLMTIQSADHRRANCSADPRTVHQALFELFEIWGTLEWRPIEAFKIEAAAFARPNTGR